MELKLRSYMKIVETENSPPQEIITTIIMAVIMYWNRVYYISFYIGATHHLHNIVKKPVNTIVTFSIIL